MIQRKTKTGAGALMREYLTLAQALVIVPEGETWLRAEVEEPEPAPLGRLRLS